MSSLSSPVGFMERFHAARRDGRLRSALAGRLQVLNQYARSTLSLIHDPYPNIEICCSPGFKTPETGSLALATRILRSLQKMKADEPQQDSCYRPSSLWERQLMNSFPEMQRAVVENDVSLFHHVLSNFGNWPRPNGIEHGDFFRRHIRTPLGRKYLKRVFTQQFEFWNWWFDKPRALEFLTYPRCSNQCGFMIDGVFSGLGSCSNDALANIVSGLTASDPMMLEVGAGSGRFAYTYLRDKPSFKYVDVDLPDILTCAAFFLGHCFPERRIWLYGETGDWRDADLAFLPPWMIEHVPDDYADLAFNKNSLGEMKPTTAANYIKHISRVTRGWFFHINHGSVRNVFDDGTKSLVTSEYRPANMTLRLRQPEFWHAVYLGGQLHDSDIYLYAYERD